MMLQRLVWGRHVADATQGRREIRVTGPSMGEKKRRERRKKLELIISLRVLIIAKHGWSGKAG